ncbi:MAG: hypothetical protein DWQ47_15085 [Acidobacteria bacterium]|nr:MAG: hypothetical protein DWQ32_02485 [Acidobacteriota bacterium]REK02612.1 MAG: hypothetical protein DWQ38_09650 [Acidobacteriota bacterium]REK13585.1 MAG: hypothetical protein DWQ43_08175 [Acidobacteriota bacterium]REK41579.1 MAG: hypothetical protein DWQ47_15085 [Acidobacteriota bacterium]
MPVVLDETERFEQTYPFDPNGRIEVENINGSIVIEAWDSPQIKLVATKIADSRERLNDVEIEIDAGQSEFSVRTKYKSWKDRVKDGDDERKYSKLSVDFRLMVPRTAQLKEIETINGSVDVSDMTSYTEVSAVNGAVKGINLRGTAKLSTVNGTVLADFRDLNGDSTIALSTVNGTVKLDLPSNTNATVKADSVNGEISNDFGLPVRKGKYVGRDLYGRIGTGEVKIKLNSVNGGIDIGRKNDGGSPNPVVDLLPQKTADDFDDTFESRFELEMERINRDYDRALKESQANIEFSGKELEKAMKAFEVAIAEDAAELVIDAEAIERATEALKNKELSMDLEAERTRIEAELARASEALYLGRSPFVEEKSGSFEVSGEPTVIVDAKSCAVNVKGWDRQEIKYSVTRLKRNQDSGKVEVQTFKKGNEVTLEVKNSTAARGSGSEFLNKVRLEVFVPKKSNLRILTDGEVRLEGITGDLELIGSKGAINIRDSYGSLNIQDTIGTVRIVGFNGSLETQDVEGDLYLEGDFKKIHAVDGVGDVFLTLGENANALISACEIDLLDAVAVNDTTYRMGPISLIKQEEGIWKVGSGTAIYKFEQEGALQVRPKSSMFIN